MIETPRLLLRRPRLSDVPALFAFLGDAEAMRHTQVDATLRDCRKRIAVHERRRRHDGFAPWTIARREDDRIVGWGGLYIDPFQPGWGAELGYFFDRSAWGHGYASELARACTAVADSELALTSLRAFAHPDNTGSRRVLEKAGFTIVRFVPEMDRYLFERVRPASVSRE